LRLCLILWLSVVLLWTALLGLSVLLLLRGVVLPLRMLLRTSVLCAALLLHGIARIAGSQQKEKSCRTSNCNRICLHVIDLHLACSA
jgi:hypothetical protein